MTQPVREQLGSVAEAPKRLHELAERFTLPNWDRKAIADDAREMTGAEFARALDAAEASLRAQAITPGDRILLINENSISAAIAILAAGRTGAWVAPVNARHTANELAGIANHYQPHLTLYTVESSSAAAKHAEACGAQSLGFGDGDEIAALRGDGSGADAESGSRASDVAVVIYTSGTTGTPKGVMLTHGNLIFNARIAGEIRRFTHDDCPYAVLPVSHVFGLGSVLLSAFYYGTRLLLAARFDAEKTARAFAQGRVSVLNAVPTVYTRLVEYAAAQGGELPAPKLRYMSSGGGPLDPTLKARIEALLHQPLHNGYGLSESSPSALMTRPEKPASDITVGTAVPEVEARIVDPESCEALPDGEIGELWLRGPNIMKGYYRDPQLTRKTLVDDGWLRTGDLGRRSAEGNFYIVDRMKQVIIHSGFNIYPAEVEAAIKSHDAVTQCAVVGAPRDDGEEVVVAFIEAHAGKAVRGEELTAYLRGLIAPYKLPSRYVFMERLPTGPTGKILRAALQEQAKEPAATT